MKIENLIKKASWTAFSSHHEMNRPSAPKVNISSLIEQSQCEIHFHHKILKLTQSIWLTRWISRTATIDLILKIVILAYLSFYYSFSSQFLPYYLPKCVISYHIYQIDIIFKLDHTIEAEVFINFRFRT